MFTARLYGDVDSEIGTREMRMKVEKIIFPNPIDGLNPSPGLGYHSFTELSHRTEKPEAKESEIPGLIATRARRVHGLG